MLVHKFDQMSVLIAAIGTGTCTRSYRPWSSTAAWTAKPTWWTLAPALAGRRPVTPCLIRPGGCSGGLRVLVI